MARLVGISEAVSLGVHTMVLLAQQPDRRFTNQEIARALHASWHHLAKVMRHLVKVGLVDSIRGPGGGFVLAKPARKVTLLDVFEAIEGPLEKDSCFARTQLCQGPSCVLGQAFRSVHEQLRKFLRSTTLAQLAGDKPLRFCHDQATDERGRVRR
ncbi:MAG: Rrf2 family transcriptional regulator [Planctomycetes bacterium]|nr:Rrf2 family transcriptional regulator [Planctomycetota bacterium]